MSLVKMFIEKLTNNKFNIALVILWSILVTSLVIKTYWVAYNTSPRLIHEKPLIPTYDLKGLEALDLFMIALAGVVVGLFMTDVNCMFYGYVGTVLLSYFISVVYIFFYIWYVLDFNSLFSLYVYEWELAVYAALVTAFILMVPWAVCFCLIGLVVGVFIRTWIGWS